MALPLMPKATAVWLIDNTTLTFEQIAAFTGMHPLEIKGIADGEVAQGIVGQDPVQTGQLKREEIEQGEKSPAYRLQLTQSTVEIGKTKGNARYTPVAKRQDKPNAIMWLAKFHPEVSDAQIGRLLGTTKKTIVDIKERKHWNIANIKPQDPVSVGLCSQLQLDEVVIEAQKAKERAQRKAERAALDKARLRGTPMPAAPATEDEDPIAVPLDDVPALETEAGKETN